MSSGRSPRSVDRDVGYADGVADPERTDDLLGHESSTAARPAQPCLIFVHIPRAAGQTLNSIIGRCYRPSEVFTYGGPVGQPIAISSLDTSELRVVKGHIPFGIDEQLHVPTTYVTFLREPVARVLSLHRYIGENPRHPLHGSVGSMSLGEFVTSEIDDVEVANGQTRQLSGLPDHAPGPQMLESAKHHLTTEFVAVGVTERFDESLLVLRHAVGWPIPLYRARNATTAARSRLAPEVRRLIESRNALDLELYRFANELLDEQVAEEGSLFPLRLVAFRALNGASRLYHAAFRRRRRRKIA